MSKKPIYEELQQKITKLEEEGLRQGEERYRAIVENRTEMICCFLQNGTLTFVNEAYCRFFEKNREELIGHKFMPLIPESDREEAFKNISSLTPDNPIVTNEHRVFAPNGEIFWHKWINRAIFDNQDKLTEYQAVGWDITERKQTEKALLESKEKFEMIFTYSSDGIIVADPETKKFLYVNPAICKMLGYTEEELTQMGVVDIHPKNSLEHVVSEFEAQARGEKLLAMNIPFLRKNGTIIYMDTNSSIVRMGRKPKIMGVFRDITDRKLAKEALKKAHDELEKRVKERTRELKIKTKSLEEINTAMTVLLKQREEDKTELENTLLTNVKELIMPLVGKLKNTQLDAHQKTYLSIIESNLNEIISPFTRRLSLEFLNLTPTEIQIANMTKHGTASKKIAEIMSISPKTVDTHKKNIRRKIGLKGKRANLRSYLLSLH